MIEIEHDLSKLKTQGVSPYVISKLKITIVDKIAIIQVPEVYELGMLFLRYQEYYESPNPLFNRQPFTIIDFMNWYRKEMKSKSFTYPEDYIGYNIPLVHMIQCYGVISDFNEYDRIMNLLMTDMTRHGVEYVIGVPHYISDKMDSTLKHEIAHAFWYTIPEYRFEMEALIKDLTKGQYNAFVKVFKTLMYGPDHYSDEAHAYLATGIHVDMRKIQGVRNREKLFKSVFNRYYRQFSKIILNKNSNAKKTEKQK